MNKEARITLFVGILGIIVNIFDWFVPTILSSISNVRNIVYISIWMALLFPFYSIFRNRSVISRKAILYSILLSILVTISVLLLIFLSGRSSLSILLYAILITQVIFCFLFWLFIFKIPQEKIVIAVADFEGNEPKKYRITESLIEMLKKIEKEYKKVKVVSLGEQITTQDGDIIAKKKGRKNNASILIWGYYSASQLGKVTIRIELIEENMPIFSRKTELEAQFVLSQPIEILEIPLEEFENSQITRKVSEKVRCVLEYINGLIYFALKEYAKSIEVISNVIDNPYWNDNIIRIEILHYNRGKAYIFNEEYAEGIEDLSLCLKNDEKNSDAYVLRGIAYNKFRKYNESLDDLQKALRIAPTNNTHNNIGAVLSNMGKLEEGLHFLKIAYKHEPKDFVLNLNLGITYRVLEEYKESVKHFKRSIKYYREINYPVSEKGSIYNELGVTYFNQKKSPVSR